MTQPEDGATTSRSTEEALIQLSTEIAAYRTVDDLLKHLPAHLLRLFPFDGVGIMLHETGTDDMRLTVSFGGDRRRVPERTHVDFGPAGWVWQSQQPRIDNLTGAEEHPTLATLYSMGFRTVRWLPLSTPRSRLGTF